MIRQSIESTHISPAITPTNFMVQDHKKGGYVYGISEGDILFGIPLGKDVQGNLDNCILNIWRSTDKSRWFPIINTEPGIVSSDLYPFYYYADLGTIRQVRIINGFSIKGFVDKNRNRLGMFLIPEMIEGVPQLKIELTVLSNTGMVFKEKYDLLYDRIDMEKTPLDLCIIDIRANYRLGLTDIINKYPDEISGEDITLTVNRDNHYVVIFKVEKKIKKEIYQEILDYTTAFNKGDKNPLIIQRLGLKNILHNELPTSHYVDMLRGYGREEEAAKTEKEILAAAAMTIPAEETKKKYGNRKNDRRKQDNGTNQPKANPKAMNKLNKAKDKFTSQK